MFANFIYFIVALLIYSTYRFSGETNFSGMESVGLFSGITLLFVLFSRQQFRRIVAHLGNHTADEMDRRFSTTQTRQAIGAMVIFAVNIYGLNLPTFVAGIPVFEMVPTLGALVFMFLFTCYLAIVWFNAYDAYQRIYHAQINRRAYVISNIQFSVPVLLPWMLLSCITDLILALPFEWPRQVLNTPEGEIAYFLLFLLAVTIFGPLIIQQFWRCRPLEQGLYRDRIQQICRRAKVRYADILYWPIFGGRMITAAVMGLVGRFRYILVTEGLLHLLSPQEIDAVIAHEVGHVKKRHLLWYVVLLSGFSLLLFAIENLSEKFFILSIVITDVVFQFTRNTEIDLNSVKIGFQSCVVIISFVLYFRYVFGYFMRNFERQADGFVYHLFPSSTPLISTFEKIVAFSGHSADKPNWHHFSIQQRMDFLYGCERDRGWIGRHDRKVRLSLVAYLLVMILVGIAGYQLNFGQTGKVLNEKILETAIRAESGNSVESQAFLYGRLGDLYFGRQQFQQAVAAYDRSLAIQPHSALVLNNYAWLLATCPDPAWRDATRALELARKAAALERSPHILDTLAESLYLNGHIDAAIDAAQEARTLATNKPAYYDGQLEKFQAARKDDASN